MNSTLEKEINGVLLTRDTLIDVHGKLVHHVCKRFTIRAKLLGMELDDLTSLGFIGLIKAFDNFDGDKYNVKFSTYAVPMISGVIKKCLQDQNMGLKYPRKIKEIAYMILNRDLRGDGIDVIAAKLDVNRSKVIHALSFLEHKNPQSLDANFSADDFNEATIYNLVSFSDDTTDLLVTDFLKTLTAREQTIVTDLTHGQLQQVIGQKLGLSQVQVSRIKTKIGVKYLKFNEARP